MRAEPATRFNDMTVKNSKMRYGDEPNRRVFDLAEIGIPDIPVLYFARNTKLGVPVEPHYHEGCFEVGLCLRGSLVLESNGDRHKLLADDMFLNRPTDVHRLLDYPKGSVRYGMLIRTEGPKRTLLRFTQAESTEIRKRLYALPAHLVANTSMVKREFAELFRAYDSLQGRYRTICMTAIITRLVIGLLEISRHGPQVSRSDRIGAIIETMRRAPEKQYDIDTLAHQAALSPAHFIVQFKAVTGVPPYHFLLTCRIEEAKRRLRVKGLSVTRIAQDLGFCSSQHFASHFKRATGMTPLAWRKQRE
jgi:AraC-like DNA-binding protein